MQREREKGGLTPLHNEEEEWRVGKPVFGTETWAACCIMTNNPHHLKNAKCICGRKGRQAGMPCTHACRPLIPTDGTSL